jgi:hypothetical protein
MEVDGIIASPIVLIASPLERNTLSIVLITMEVDDIAGDAIRTIGNAMT